MNNPWTFATATMAFALTLIPGAARADSGGMANLHDQARYGNRVCFTDHTHSGSGSSYVKAAAIADAKRAWSDFVVFEYGGEWGSFEKAVNQSVTCGGLSSSYQCTASANACRPAGAAFAVLATAKHKVANIYKKKRRKL